MCDAAADELQRGVVLDAVTYGQPCLGLLESTLGQNLTLGVCLSSQAGQRSAKGQLS